MEKELKCIIHEINKILTKKNNVSVKETIQEGF